jgi:hypothetical protein
MSQTDSALINVEAPERDPLMVHLCTRCCPERSLCGITDGGWAVGIPGDIAPKADCVVCAEVAFGMGLFCPTCGKGRLP